MGGFQGSWTGCDLRGADLLDHNMGGEMSVIFALSIAAITLGSCVACYFIGREAGRIKAESEILTNFEIKTKVFPAVPAVGWIIIDEYIS